MTAEKNIFFESESKDCQMDVSNTGNGERGTGNREREPGNECTPATLLRVQNGGQNKRKGSNRNNLGKGEFPPAVPPDGQYVLVRAESD